MLLIFFVGILSFGCETKKKNIDTSSNLTPSVEKEIIIFGSENCDHCIQFRQKADSLNIKYLFKDAEANEQYYNELMMIIQQSNFKEYVGFPVVVIDGKLYVRPEFDTFLTLIDN